MKKKIMTLTAGIVLTCIAFAQKASLGITAGATLANYKVKIDGEDESSNSKAGITAGLVANIPAGKNFMIQTGAHWVQKGTKEEEGGETASLNVNSIEVPVNFLYSSNGGFFIGAGPSASFAVSGKWKYSDVSAKVHFGNSEDDDMKGFDFGANLVAGYRSPGGFLIMGNFNQGLSNLAPGDADGATIKSHYVGIRLGYLFNQRH